MMQYIDLKGFEKFMEDRDLVDTSHRSFYLHWVRRFLKLELSSGDLNEKDKVECFADQLARDPSVKEGLLRQALQAVSLYLDDICPRRPAGEGDTPAALFMPDGANLRHVGGALPEVCQTPGCDAG
jgi:hypothetical protein